jgi:hypothetical protein
MIDGSRHLAFADESRAMVFTVQLLVQDLERDPTALLAVLRLIDLSHTAAPESSQNVVRAEQLAGNRTGLLTERLVWGRERVGRRLLGGQVLLIGEIGFRVVDRLQQARGTQAFRGKSRQVGAAA